MNLQKNTNTQNLFIIAAFALQLAYIILFIQNQYVTTPYIPRGFNLSPIFLDSSLRNISLNEICLTNAIYNLLSMYSLSLETIFNILITTTYFFLLLFFFKTACLRCSPYTIFIPFALLTNTTLMLHELVSLNFHIEQAYIFLIILYLYQKKEKYLSILNTSLFYILFIYCLIKYNNFLMYAAIFSCCEVFCYITGETVNLKKRQLSSFLPLIILVVFITFNYQGIDIYLKQKTFLFNYTNTDTFLTCLANSFQLFVRNLNFTFPKTYQIFFAASVSLYGIYIFYKIIKREKYKISLTIFSLSAIPILIHILSVDGSFNLKKENTLLSDIFPALTLIPLMSAEITTLILNKFSNQRKKIILFILYSFLLTHIFSEKNFSKLFFDIPTTERKNATEIFEDIRKHIKGKANHEAIIIAGKKSYLYFFYCGFRLLGIKPIVYINENIPQTVIKKINKPSTIKYTFYAQNTYEKNEIYVLQPSKQKRR